MLVKDLKVPLHILKAEAILRWIPHHHPRRNLIESDLRQDRAGFVGEKSARYYINMLNDPHVRVLHGVRLPGDSSAFQIDYLFISPHVILILEVKHISGTITVGDPFNQCLRKDDHGEIERLKDPLSQVQIHRRQLIRWLKKNSPTSIPIEYLIVNTHPKAIIQVVNPQSEYVDKYFTEERLPHKLQEVTSKYSREHLTSQKIDELTTLIHKKSNDLNKDILEKYNVKPTELVRGVKCPHCQNTIMKRQYGKWKCSKCQYSSKDAHLHALKDYFLLFNKPISNKICREWLGLKSRHVAQRLLKKMDLIEKGNRKGAIYYPPDSSFFRK